MVVLNRFVGLRKFTSKSFFVLLTITEIFLGEFELSFSWPFQSGESRILPAFFLEYLRYLYCKRVHQLSKNFCITASIAFLMKRCVQSMSMMALYHKDIVLFYKMYVFKNHVHQRSFYVSMIQSSLFNCYK